MIGLLRFAALVCGLLAIPAFLFMLSQLGQPGAGGILAFLSAASLFGTLAAGFLVWLWMAEVLRQLSKASQQLSDLAARLGPPHAGGGAPPERSEPRL